MNTRRNMVILASFTQLKGQSILIFWLELDLPTQTFVLYFVSTLCIYFGLGYPILF